MKGRKPSLQNVVPMKGDAPRRVPDAPEYISGEALKVWDDLAPVLAQAGHLEPAYVHELAAYCESVSNFIAATHSLACEGYYYTVKTRNGNQQKKTAPWGLQQEAMAAMARGAARFGLSPVDSARLKSGDQGDLFADVLDQLKGKGRAS